MEGTLTLEPESVNLSANLVTYHLLKYLIPLSFSFFLLKQDSVFIYVSLIYFMHACVSVHVHMYMHTHTHTHTHTQLGCINLTVNQKKKRSKIREIPRQEVYSDWWLIGTQRNGKVLAPEKSISHQVCNPFPFFKVYIVK